MRRLIVPSLIALCLPACTGDGGLVVDGGSDAARCNMLAASISEWLGSHLACATDADCTSVTTACGLPSACGAFVNKSGAGGQLTQLVAEWNAGCAPAQPCNCPAWFPVPGCNAGACGWRMASRPVGESCDSGADCKSAECVTPQERPGFIGGYCTVRDCLNKGGMCPAGSACKPSNDNTSYCFKECKLGEMGQCRQGYACCSGPGPAGETGWCAPTMDFLCTTK